MTLSRRYGASALARMLIVSSLSSRPCCAACPQFGDQAERGFTARGIAKRAVEVADDGGSGTGIIEACGLLAQQACASHRIRRLSVRRSGSRDPR
jgi:hypothetical protein